VSKKDEVLILREQMELVGAKDKKQLSEYTDLQSKKLARHRDEKGLTQS
jgi:hypothetical protein